MTPRIAAYETLLHCEKEKQYSNIAVNHAIKKYQFEKRDRDFYTQLVYGVIEKKLTLDYIVKHYTEKSPSRLDLSVLLILRLSFYQLIFLDRVPQNAAVSEGVKLASRFASRAKGYVNAILRKACRESFCYPTEENYSRSFVLSIKYSVSEDIIKLLMAQYPEKIEEILQAYNTPPYLALQVNSRYFTPQTLSEHYQLQASTVNPLPFALKLNDTLSVSEMPFIANGEAFVQDIASQFAGFILDPQPDDFIIDVCSCPGGKSFSAANFMLYKNSFNVKLQGKILSCDLHESKLSLVKNGADRLGYHFIETRCHDASQPITEYIEKADRVICDVPCSGIGVIAKKPEIRYKDIQEIKEIPQIQKKILSSATAYLKKGGSLLYSTCTLNRNENEAIIEDFLKDHPNFSLAPISICTDHLACKIHNNCITFYPCALHDGFFIAKLIKQ